MVEDLINKTTKKSASEGSAQKHQTAKADKSAPVQSEVNAAPPKRIMPSDWSFFSMSADQDAALFYSPRSIRTVENNMQVLMKWTYLQKQGPAYSNSQKILKLSHGKGDEKLSYAIGTFAFNCENKTGTEIKEIYFDSEGNTILEYVPSPLVSAYFAPETVYGYLLNIICKKK